MITGSQVFSPLPQSLREELVDEFNNIVRSFNERKWGPSELSGGKFCEIVYSILAGFASGRYPPKAAKPPNFVSSCRALETYKNSPRSFQILIPRILPALYEIRNNRGVGHTGGDVNPNYMDATAVLSITAWIMAELVRVFHNISTHEAQRVVDGLVERRTPLVWQSGSMKRVLNPRLPLRNQVLLLLSSAPGEVKVEELIKWTGYENPGYFNRLLRQMHKARLIELSREETSAQILPPGERLLHG